MKSDNTRKMRLDECSINNYHGENKEEKKENIAYEACGDGKRWGGSEQVDNLP